MLENRRESIRRQIEAIGLRGAYRARARIQQAGHASSSPPTRPTSAAPSTSRPSPASPAMPRDSRSRSRRCANGRASSPAASGHRVLGIINPIQNQPSCTSAACHAHTPEQTVLGVLDVTVSLHGVDRQIAASRNRIASLAIGAVVVASLLFWWLSRRLVGRPVEALTAGTRRVAAGDLTTAIPAGGRNELGELARAFNAMTARLSEAQRQITQADKLASVGRLAAGVAHEINNPLTGVLTFSSLLLDRAQNDPEQRADLEVIVRETKRCREIVRCLLDFARQTPPRRQATDLNDVARRAVAVVMNQLQLSHVGSQPRPRRGPAVGGGRPEPDAAGIRQPVAQRRRRDRRTGRRDPARQPPHRAVAARSRTHPSGRLPERMQSARCQHARRRVGGHSHPARAGRQGVDVLSRSRLRPLQSLGRTLRRRRGGARLLPSLPASPCSSPSASASSAARRRLPSAAPATNRSAGARASAATSPRGQRASSAVRCRWSK